MMRVRSSAIVMTLYLLFLLIPIYWLINMSLKTNTEITSQTLIPNHGLRATIGEFLANHQ